MQPVIATPSNPPTTQLTNPFSEKSPQHTDEELLAHANAGDRNQLGLLLSRHTPWIYNLAIRMLHRHADAEDAT